MNKDKELINKKVRHEIQQSVNQNKELGLIRGCEMHQAGRRCLGCHRGQNDTTPNKLFNLKPVTDKSNKQ